MTMVEGLALSVCATVEYPERLGLPSSKMYSSRIFTSRGPHLHIAQAPSMRATSTCRPRYRGSLSYKTCPALSMMPPTQQAFYPLVARSKMELANPARLDVHVG